MVESKLKPYLSDSEINSLCERKKRIVARLQRLIEEKGERIVKAAKKALVRDFEAFMQAN